MTDSDCSTTGGHRRGLESPPPLCSFAWLAALLRVSFLLQPRLLDSIRTGWPGVARVHWQRVDTAVSTVPPLYCSQSRNEAASVCHEGGCFLLLLKLASSFCRERHQLLFTQHRRDRPTPQVNKRSSYIGRKANQSCRTRAISF